MWTVTKGPVSEMTTVVNRPMTDALADAPITTTGETVVVPLERSGGRTVGVVIVDRDGARCRPVVDLERLAWCAVAAAGLAAAAALATTAARRRPAIGSVTMGPGGWVSLKGGALRPAGRRPWWARLLGARRLVVE
jgi:hypothetical protein